MFVGGVWSVPDACTVEHQRITTTAVAGRAIDGIPRPVVGAAVVEVPRPVWPVAEDLHRMGRRITDVE
jgi:hypothetical protein